MLQEAAGPATTYPARDIPDLDREDVRADLRDAALEAVLKLSDIWRLNSKQMAGLLNLGSDTEWFELKSRNIKYLTSKDSLLRVSALVGLYKGLSLLFSEPLSNEWIKIPNEEEIFERTSPLEYMTKGGVSAMIKTRAYIDALRGGL